MILMAHDLAPEEKMVLVLITVPCIDIGTRNIFLSLL